MADLYDELLKATDNLQDISFSRYGTITSITDDLCSVKEEEQDITHQNVPVLNGLELKRGDNVVLGFVNNDLYNPLILGIIGRDVIHEMEVDLSKVDVDFNYSFGLSGIDDSLSINAFLKLIGD